MLNHLHILFNSCAINRFSNLYKILKDPLWLFKDDRLIKDLALGKFHVIYPNRIKKLTGKVFNEMVKVKYAQ